MTVPYALLDPGDLLVVTSRPSTPAAVVEAFVADLPEAFSGRVVVVNGDSWVAQVVRCGPVPCCEHCHHGAEVKAHTQPCGRES